MRCRSWACGCACCGTRLILRSRATGACRGHDGGYQAAAAAAAAAVVVVLALAVSVPHFQLPRVTTTRASMMTPPATRAIAG
jgi:hypothetical protein